MFIFNTELSFSKEIPEFIKLRASYNEFYQDRGAKRSHVLLGYNQDELITIITKLLQAKGFCN